MSIKITADRIIDLSREELDRLNIATMPCYINIGDESFSDSDDVFPADVFNYFETTGKLAKTAAKSPDEYREFFEQFLTDNDSVIHFAASSGISCICDNAKTAAAALNGRVFVVDSRNLSNAVAILAKYALELIRGGEEDAARVVQLCESFMPRINSSFLIDDLIFLYKGGRCSTLSFYAANFLKIKPVIFLDTDGRMKVREKTKGSKEKALAVYIRKSFEKKPPQTSEIYFALTSKNEKTEALILSILADLKYSFGHVYFNAGSCNCCVHGGRNTVGMFYVNK